MRLRSRDAMPLSLMPYTSPAARPLGVAALAIAVLDEPLPAVGWSRLGFAGNSGLD
jgi:hypothetical protein